MKKIIILLIFFLSLLIFPKDSFAYQQTDAVCYSQCAAYKFVWRGDVCYDLFAANCSGDEGSTITKTIKFLKSVYDVVESGDDVDSVFKAWFVCKPLIENCIVPQLNECHNTCKNVSQAYYAPNLSVGNPYGSTAYQNVYYDEDRHQLVFKVINNGGYASDIDVTASWGHTPNRDKIVSGGGTLFTEKIPELVFFGARVGTPKTPGDYVTDFLIDQSNFSSWLSKYKSDANNHYVPPAWYKTVPFTAPEGEFTKVILNVDPSQMIPESNEGDNTYILEIDKLPTPVSLAVENLNFKRTNPTSLTEYMVSFDLKNSGQESGNAYVKWYLGNYESGKSPIYEQNMLVQGQNQVHFDHSLNIDVSDGGNSCNYAQKYTIVAFDDQGFIKTKYEFSIPSFAGSISGRVNDLFGKKVIGAKITTNTGQEAITNSMGDYYIHGIPVLGKITLTATHPDFSKTETKEVEIKFDDSKDKCHVAGLALNGINFVLKDQDVMFTVTIKDNYGNPVAAQVLALNSDWRFNEIVNGTGPLPGMQPGKYTFTISAPGYKTISQDVNAVPNDQSLEFTLEKLQGRPDDTGLRLISPKLLWKKTLGSGERIIGNIKGTKNGKLLVASVASNKAKTRSLFFLDPLSGRQIKETLVPYSVEQQRFIGLDTSYDGGTVGLFVNPGMGVTKQEGILKIFNAQGDETGTTTLNKQMAISMDVSPDGFYVCPYVLLNKGLHKYTKHETEGVGDDDFRRNPATCPDYFLRNNNRIDSCKDGLCEKTIANQQVRVIGDTDGGTPFYDSTFDDKTIVVRTYKKLYYFGQSSWNKELTSDNSFKSVAVSPGGMYTLVTVGSGSDALLKLKVFGNSGQDKTPDFLYKDVKFVYANDKGLFFASIVLNRISFYQIGEFQTEYKPETTLPTATPQTMTSNLSYYQDGSFHQTGDVNFADLLWGKIYLADQNTKLYMNDNLGSLTILKGTLFALDDGDSPILLKGQMTADFNSPAEIYAIKFDRYDMNLFQTKLDQFRAKTLPASEYFVINNIHTIFTLKNYPNNFNVSVDSGQVKVLANKTEKVVDSGRQISIDPSNNIKESIYINFKIKVIILAIFVLILGIILFIYRNTKIGRKIIFNLNIIFTFIWKTIRKFLNLLWISIKKLVVGIRRILKSFKKE